jgi:hypothetical protein
MDSILHYTDGTTTLVATASFVITFIVGVWLGARFGKKTVLPALVLGAIAVYLRSTAFPLSVEAIAAVSLLHVAAGALTALLVGRKSSK